MSMTRLGDKRPEDGQRVHLQLAHAGKRWSGFATFQAQNSFARPEGAWLWEGKRSAMGAFGAGLADLWEPA